MATGDGSKTKSETSDVLELPRLGVGLVHWPVLDRRKSVVATNITNLDVHDIARISRVYGVDSYYLIHPMQEQLMFVERLLDHWRVGEGKKFNPMRATALTMVKTATSLEAAVASWGDPNAVVVGTTAREIPGINRVRFGELRAFLRSPLRDSQKAGSWSVEQGPRALGEIEATDAWPSVRPEIRQVLEGKKSVFLIFGTGFGMTEELLRSCHLLLEPMRGAPPLDYRHLSVRSAASICLDRLRGSW